MKTLRGRVLLASLSLIFIVWGGVLTLITRQPQLSPLGQQWQQEAPEANQAFFFLAGFNASKDADPKLYGQHKWRSYLEPEQPGSASIEPAKWRFGIPCRVAQIECLLALEPQKVALTERLNTDQLWLGRFKQLLEGEAPIAPFEPVKQRFSSVPQQLSSAFELQLADFINTLFEADKAQQVELFQQFNHHLERMIYHIEHTNLVAYRKFLLNGLRGELAWLVAQLQVQPELKGVAAQHLKALSEREQLAASLTDVLQREFAHSNHLFTQIEQQGVSEALGWELKVSSLFQTMTWQKNRTLNVLAENYQHALELNQGQHGLDLLASASESWPQQETMWREDNLIGALLLKDRLAQLSTLLKTSFLAEAYYAMTRAWLIQQDSELPQSVDLLGEEVGWQERPLEKRLCLKLPKIQSLDDSCLRLFESSSPLPTTESF